MSKHHKKNLAIFTTTTNNVTETFIHNHINRIPHNNTVFYGTPFPYMVNEEKKLNLAEEYLLKYKAKTRHQDWQLLNKKIQLRNNLKKHSIEIVLAEFLTTGAGTYKTCKELGIPMIVTALGYDVSIDSIIKKYENEYRELFKYAKAVIIVSNHMRACLLQLGCDEKKIVYSPAGPSNDFFNITPNFSTNAIFALGRFVEKKAPHLLLLSFRKVLDKMPDAHLYFGGGGNLSNVVNDLINVLNLQNNVTLLGWISQDEQKKHLQCSSVFVQHSKTAENGDSEGTPVAILEASAAGLPIVSTLHAGIPEVVINNVTGFLVEENDIENMAEKIIILLQDKQLAEQMGKKGRNFISKNFTLERHIQIINSVIEN